MLERGDKKGKRRRGCKKESKRKRGCKGEKMTENKAKKGGSIKR